MVYGIYNYSYWGESKPTNITGGPHIVTINDIVISRITVMAMAISYNWLFLWDYTFYKWG